MCVCASVRRAPTCVLATRERATDRRKRTQMSLPEVSSFLEGCTIIATSRKQQLCLSLLVAEPANDSDCFLESFANELPALECKVLPVCLFNNSHSYNEQVAINCDSNGCCCYPLAHSLAHKPSLAGVFLPATSIDTLMREPMRRSLARLHCQEGGVCGDG